MTLSLHSDGSTLTAFIAVGLATCLSPSLDMLREVLYTLLHVGVPVMQGLSQYPLTKSTLSYRHLPMVIVTPLYGMKIFRTVVIQN